MIPGRSIILASKSPRRQQLLKELGYPFTVVTKEVEEIYPPHLVREQVPLFLAELKAKAFNETLSEKDVVITADTIVYCEGKILGKPLDFQDATGILNMLSGKKHEVITGVCLHNKHTLYSFYVVTDVYFKTLSAEEISYYLERYQPYDKAGSYGIQEWIGLIGIEKIVGSYFNVMGLPVKELHEALMKF